MLKHSVIPTGIQTETLLAYVIAQQIYAKYGYDCIITSIVDGTHSRQSLHYVGFAIDLRIRHMEEPHKEEIFKEIKKALTTDYDVVLHSTHIHIEYQPKRP